MAFLNKYGTSTTGTKMTPIFSEVSVVSFSLTSPHLNPQHAAMEDSRICPELVEIVTVVASATLSTGKRKKKRISTGKLSIPGNEFSFHT